MSATVDAHEVRPAYLELRQTSADTYDVLWKVPARGDLRLGIYVTLPADTEQLAEPRGIFADRCVCRTMEHSLRRVAWPVRRFASPGWTATQIDVLARIEHANGAVQTVRVLPDNPAFVVETRPVGVERMRQRI